MWSEIRGHDRLREQFEQAVRRGRMAHAYLFVGPEGVGKRTFARALAQGLFCERRTEDALDACGNCRSCIQMQAGTHPDLLSVALPPGKRELPIELMVGADERRGREGLCHELALRPMTADRRIAIVDDAQTMNAESANALLKTLEEPPPESLLILLTPALDAMLPTIRSRCQPVLFAPLAEDDVAELLLALAWVPDEQTARETARLAGGSLFTARQLLLPELRQLRELLFSGLAEAEIDPFALAETVQAKLEALSADQATQRVHAGWAVRFCGEFFRGQIRELASTPGDPADFDTDADLFDRLAAQLERCLEAEGHLHQSMPVPLCLEGLFDALANIRRRPAPV